MEKNTTLFLKSVKNGLGENRNTFIIPGKNIKKAVIRNKIRRRVREILRKNSENIKKGNDLFFIFGKAAEKSSFGLLEEEIMSALRLRRLIK